VRPAAQARSTTTWHSFLLPLMRRGAEASHVDAHLGEDDLGISGEWGCALTGSLAGVTPLTASSGNTARRVAAGLLTYSGFGISTVPDSPVAGTVVTGTEESTLSNSSMRCS
jgi:hypothetical protein